MTNETWDYKRIQQLILDTASSYPSFKVYSSTEKDKIIDSFRATLFIAERFINEKIKEENHANRTTN